MTYALRIAAKHPSGPEFMLLANGQRIASGRINKSAIADLVVMFFLLRKCNGDIQHE